MAQYTAGQMKKFFYKAELTYGLMVATALVWGGEIISLNPAGTDLSPEFITLAGSRSFGDTVSGPKKVGFTLRALSRRTTHDWTVFWMAYGGGSINGLADALGSFTAQFARGTTNYNFYNGCKINKLSIIGEDYGKPVVFEAEVFAQWVNVATSKTLTALQSVTIGADPADITTGIITWDTKLTYNIGGGAVDWYPTTFKLTVDNHLERQMGIRVGADTAKYPVAIGLNEGGRDIILEVKQPAANETWQNAKIAGTAITSVTITIDTLVITLSNGVLEANDLGEMKQDLMDETIKMRFKSLAIA